jgi:DNA repair ATPase RecN
MAKREAYINRIKAQLDDLNIDLAEVEVRAEKSKEVAKEKYAVEVAKLYAQAQQLRDKLKEIKSASESTWENMIASTEKLHDALVNSFKYFKTQLKNH